MDDVLCATDRPTCFLARLNFWTAFVAWTFAEVKQVHDVFCLPRAQACEKIGASSFESPMRLDRRRTQNRGLACRLNRSVTGAFLAVLSCLLAAAVSGCGANYVTNASSSASPLSAPSSVEFGTVTVGQTSSSNVTLINRTSSAVDISQLSITGNTFSITGQNTLPISIAPNGGTYTLTLQFAPNGAGDATGQLTVSTTSLTGGTVSAASTTPMSSGFLSAASSTSSNGNSLKIKLHGKGQTNSGSGSATVSSLACTMASITGAGTDSCTVTLSAAAATGGLVVSLSSNNSAVTVPASVTVPAGATSAGFTATVSAVTTAQTTTLTASAGGVTVTCSLQLNAATVTMTVSSTNVPFGDVIVNTTATQSVTLTSSGTSQLTVNSGTVTGAGFSISGMTFPLTLNPGQSATLDIAFDPTVTGAATGNVTLSTNASTGGTATISLSGNGVAASYQVNLTWSPPTSSTDPVAGYNVYRATGTSTSYQRLNSSLDAQAAYTDANLQNGTSYSYYVVSVDSQGNQSVPSNIYTVTIP